MQEQEQFWKQEYASNYIQKNAEFNHEKGVACWKQMLHCAGNIGSVLECGSNIGRNIGFLQDVLPAAEKSIIEISPEAYKIITARFSFKHTFNGPILDASFPGTFDLVYTTGVLIHIAPDELKAHMQRMYDWSNNYILMGEYFNRTPVMIEYQGKQNKLFKRDFGKLFIESFNVELVDYGFLWGHLFDDAGFDDITYWLFKKK